MHRDASGVPAYVVAVLQVRSSVAAWIVWLLPGRGQQFFDAPVSDRYWATLFPGSGLPMIVLSILVLLLNNTRGVREWYANA